MLAIGAPGVSELMIIALILGGLLIGLIVLLRIIFKKK